MDNSIAHIEISLKTFFETEREVNAVFIFGSLITGYRHSFSDIDIAVLLNDEEHIAVDYKIGLLTDLIVLLGSDQIDLVILNQAPPFLKYRILRDGSCIFERDKNKRTNFQARTYSEYFDLRPLLKKVYGI